MTEVPLPVEQVKDQDKDSNKTFKTRRSNSSQQTGVVNPFMLILRQLSCLEIVMYLTMGHFSTSLDQS